MRDYTADGFEGRISMDRKCQLDRKNMPEPISLIVPNSRLACFVNKITYDPLNRARMVTKACRKTYL